MTYTKSSQFPNEPDTSGGRVSSSNGGFVYNGQVKRSLRRPHANSNIDLVKYYKLAGNTAQTFFVPSEEFKSIDSLLIVNTHITDSVTVNLYEYFPNVKISTNTIESGTYTLGADDASQVRSPITDADADVMQNRNVDNPLSARNVVGNKERYILYNTVIPNGASLLLDSNDFVYKKTGSEGSLYVKLGHSGSSINIRVIEKRR